ncbi:MAG: response regulator transcription factor [Lachnospiraceae bacterium]|nr:response regulator transcription factor [Lachnospiraceae bacterium]
MRNILVCDDEKDIVKAIKIYLSSEGYNVIEANDGLEALEAFKNNEIHLILLDIMMPKMDGLTTLHNIRQESNVPVIFLSAKSEDTDKILGLNIGADDYITKPFNPAELIARVRSMLRRYMDFGEKNKSDIITIGNISLNDRTKIVEKDGSEVNLTPREFDILKLLMNNPKKVFSPKEIYVKIWGEEPVNVDNSVAVHIRHLREKLEINPAQPRYIKVVWGQGYKMEEM